MRRKHQQGFTLVETLAVVVIISIISVLLFSILSSSTSTHQKQAKKNKNLQDTSYALKLITKDFRKATQFDDATDTFTTRDGQQTYILSNNTITRNGEIIATNIKEFELKNKNHNTQNKPIILTIRIKNTSDKEISSELTSRGMKTP
ncbi:MULTISPECIES: type II secretion system protein J [Lysinibacillus]|uniref:PulJ/GspJ family protein n=1 Tax=Lysinibacillus TaxID=400634 RepID=UPI0022B9985D|nr:MULTISPECIES: prepilin-type N-terminal cleavage/methylation domain-containing protein [Lysinibacillus]WBF56090.1 prepilin-type N-terminal cleavage/methylation domain-containing protein [Lysinibacillus sp. JK80]